MRVQVTQVHDIGIGLSLLPNDVELAEDGSNIHPFGISKTGFEECIQFECRRIVVVVTEYGRIIKPLPAWGMSESRSKVVEPGNWLKADVVVRVNRSDFMGEMVVRPLEIVDLGEAWSHYKRVTVQVAWPGLVNQLISNHIRVALESQSNFLPISGKLIQQAAFVVPQMAESFIDCISKIKIPPWELTASLGSRKPSFVVELNAVFGERLRERVVDLARNRPERDSVCTKLFAEQILMEFNQGVYPILAGQIHQIYHRLDVSLIEVIFLGLHARPHDSQSDSIQAPVPHLLEIVLPELSLIVGRFFGDEVGAMKDP